MKITERIKKLCFENRFLHWATTRLIPKFGKRGGGYTLLNEGKARLLKDIQGKDHHIQISTGCVLNDVTIRIRGERNSIVFDENCKVGPDCSFWMEGNDISIHIGSGTTFTRRVHINAQESETGITIGKDCMFSNHIVIRTSDSHSIYDAATGERINLPKNVEIGDHVWVCPDVKIMKGAKIGDGAIVGSNTLVSGVIPEDVLVCGYPARVIKENIKWTREKLY